MDNIIESVITMLEAGLPSQYTIVYGQAPQEPDAYLPIVTVYPISTALNQGGTGGLRTRTSTFAIKAYVSLKDYFEEQNDTTVGSMKALVQLMEKEDITGVPDSDTILGIINNDTTLGGAVSNIMDFSVLYDTIPTGRYATAELTVIATSIIPDNC